MRDIAVVHYDEIALKGNNRAFFERALVDSIKNKLGSKFDIKNSWGRIFVFGEDKLHIAHVLAMTPGIATFGLGFELAHNDPREPLPIVKIGEVAIQLVESREFNSFRISARRVDKSFKKNSNEIDREVGEVVFEHFKKEKSVDLKNPDVEIAIEVLHKSIIIYIKQKGIGGLPVGSSGRAVALLSGGFDSPVAAYQLIKRGVRPVCVHFHGLPKTSPESVEKVRDIAQVLSGYAGKVELVLVPIVPAMQAIAKNAPSKLRIILLRRLMMRIAEEIANKYKAKAIITGESVGQVASQTLENLGAIGSATSLPVLQPLCGLNKVEIIDLARKIGTHDISVKPHDDTCSMFVPEKPETKADMEEVLEAEKTYDVECLVSEALENIEIETINNTQ